MTIAYWCLLVAAALPRCGRCPGVGRSMVSRPTLPPRRFEETLTGWRQRAHWAHLNAFENFPPFAITVVIAQQLHAPQPTVDGLAVAFIVLRVAHGIFYLANLGVLRTLAFAGGFGCLIAILFVAVSFKLFL